MYVYIKWEQRTLPAPQLHGGLKYISEPTWVYLLDIDILVVVVGSMVDWLYSRQQPSFINHVIYVFV